jgi:multiple antibiotic resistance protein
VGTLSSLVNAFLVVYAALFPIVNPLGSAPVFLVLTGGYTVPTRHRLARQIAVNGFLLLLGSLLLGSYILEFFGITLPVMRVAGGAVVTAMGWQLLKEGDDVREPKNAEGADDQIALRRAFYPLTMPLTVGPGSITVAIALGSKRPTASSMAELASIGAAAIVGLAAIAVTIFVCYRSAEYLARVLGETGTTVLVRLSAFILLCIGIEILWSGVAELLATVPRQAL